MDKKLDSPKPPHPKNNPWEILLISGLLLALGTTMILSQREAIVATGGYLSADAAYPPNAETIHFIGWLTFIGGLLLAAGYFKLWNDIKKGR